MVARVDYLGRAVTLRPASLGVMLQDGCTVSRFERETVWTNGRPKSSFVTKRIPMYWYTKDARGEEVFCAYAGYGSRIESILRSRGLELDVTNRVDHGLPEPDLSRVAGTTWRHRQKEVFAKLLAYDRGIIQCPTGFGKSFLIKKLAAVYPESEIIVTVPSTDIARDLYDALLFDVGVGHVGRIGDGKNDPKRVTVVSSQSLHKAPKDVSLVLCDECHALYTENYIKKLNRFHRAKMFGFSATPSGRSDKADGFGEAIFGPVIANVSYQEGVTGGNVVPLQVWMYDSSEGPALRDLADPSTVSRLCIWGNEARNRLIARSVEEALAYVGEDAQALIMVDTIEHAYRLGQLLPDFAIVSGEPTPTRLRKLIDKGVITADQTICTPKLRQEYRKRFEANDLKRAIATKVWSKGVDFKELRVLARADGLASAIDSGQVPGRLSRLPGQTDKPFGLLLDYLDKFSDNLRGRSVRRIRVYNKNGWPIINKV